MDNNQLLLLIESDERMKRILETVRELDLPDCWIGAGFVRGKVWDTLHEYTKPTPIGDIDVIYYDMSDIRESSEKLLDAKLRAVIPGEPWSAKNQARMHLLANERAYTSTEHALSLWPETATAVAVKIVKDGSLELLAPFGTEDLFGLTVRPTSHWMEKLDKYQERLKRKDWLSKWPKLTILFNELLT